MPLLAEAPNEQPAELRLVFDDQDAHAQIVAPGDEGCMKRLLIGLSSPPGQLVPMTGTDHSRALDRRVPNSRAPSAARSATTASPRSSGSSCCSASRSRERRSPFLGSLLSVHIFVGMLLLGPVALKLASTGYRLARYYTRGPEYVRLGPPAPLMRVLVAPVLVLSTLTLFGTGVLLLAVPHRGTVARCCTRRASSSGSASMTIHVLAYALRAGRGVAADFMDALPRGRWLRIALTLLAIAAGVVVAVETYPLAHPWLNHHHWLGGERLSRDSGRVDRGARRRRDRIARRLRLLDAGADHDRVLRHAEQAGRREAAHRSRVRRARPARGASGPAPRVHADRRPQQQPHADRLPHRQDRVELRPPARPRRRVLHPRLALDHHERGVQRHPAAGLAAGQARDVAVRPRGHRRLLARLPEHARRRLRAPERRT